MTNNTHIFTVTSNADKDTTSAYLSGLIADDEDANDPDYDDYTTADIYSGDVKVTIWTVAYVDDDNVDYFGTKVFTGPTAEADANTWADEWTAETADEHETLRSTVVQFHEIVLS